MYIVNPRATIKHSLSIEELEYNYKKITRKGRKRGNEIKKNIENNKRLVYFNSAILIITTLKKWFKHVIEEDLLYVVYKKSTLNVIIHMS